MAKKTYSVGTTESTPNIVEDVFNSRKEMEKPNSVLENPNVMSNQEIFDKLKSLQDDLKKEVEQNPNLQLTDTYKEMEQKYNEIITPVVEQEIKEETHLEEKKVNAENLENEIIIPIVFDNSDEENALGEENLEEKQEIYNANPEVTKNVPVVEESNETEPKKR